MSQAAAPPASQAAPDKPAAENPPAEKSAGPLDFIDSASFDLDLSDRLRGREGNIEVEVPAPFTLNDIPKRLDKWLYRVKDSGGSVKAAAVPLGDAKLAQRGLIGEAIDVVVSIFQAAEQKVLYSPAGEYNAVLQYQPGTGKVEKVLFLRR